VFPGRTHDKKIYDRSKTYHPPDIRSFGDTGYIGTALTVPHKRFKNKGLTAAQKKHNRELSSKRVCVENGIGKMKIWRIVKDRFRHGKFNHTLIMKNIAGLQNLMFA